MNAYSHFACNLAYDYSAGAGDAAFAHAAGDHSGMAGCPAMCGQKANGCIHAVDIIGGRLLAYENDR